MQNVTECYGLPIVSFTPTEFIELGVSLISCLTNTRVFYSANAKENYSAFDVIFFNGSPLLQAYNAPRTARCNLELIQRNVVGITQMANAEESHILVDVSRAPAQYNIMLSGCLLPPRSYNSCAYGHTLNEKRIE